MTSTPCGPVVARQARHHMSFAVTFDITKLIRGKLCVITYPLTGQRHYS